VASPTFAETPGLLARLAAPDGPTPMRELDDMYFARAQAAVRRALRARARVLGIGEDDVFWLPLADVRAGRVADAASRAAAARDAHAKLRAFVPPRAIVQGAPIFSPPPDADVLQGRGTGGRARGKVVRIDPQRPAPAPHAIVVVPTLTPPLALLCRDAAALISEHGGLLGHAAALARELGIPCVVGCLGADRLQEGDEVWVDADAGLVLRA
jgi:pyruvate,water dikinase